MLVIQIYSQAKKEAGRYTTTQSASTRAKKCKVTTIFWYTVLINSSLAFGKTLLCLLWNRGLASHKNILKYYSRFLWALLGQLEFLKVTATSRKQTSPFVQSLILNLNLPYGLSSLFSGWGGISLHMKDHKWTFKKCFGSYSMHFTPFILNRSFISGCFFDSPLVV